MAAARVLLLTVAAATLLLCGPCLAQDDPTPQQPSNEEILKKLQELQKEIEELRQIKELAEQLKALVEILKKQCEQAPNGEEEAPQEDEDLSNDDLKKLQDEFTKAVKAAVANLKMWYPGFGKLPSDVKRVLVLMMMEIGKSEMTKYKKLKRALKKGDWKAAADEMKDSKWYEDNVNQKRLDKLIERMRSAGSE